MQEFTFVYKTLKNVRVFLARTHECSVPFCSLFIDKINLADVQQTLHTYTHAHTNTLFRKIITIHVFNQGIIILEIDIS